MPHALVSSSQGDALHLAPLGLKLQRVSRTEQGTDRGSRNVGVDPDTEQRAAILGSRFDIGGSLHVAAMADGIFPSQKRA